MRFETTFRGLSQVQSTHATRALEKSAARFERLLEEPCVLRSVMEVDPEFRVSLSLSLPKDEVSAASTQHDLDAAISDACDKIKVQLVRLRHRRESQRHRLTA